MFHAYHIDRRYFKRKCWIKSSLGLVILSHILFLFSPVKAIQPLDADTLFFHDEAEFHEFVEYYGLKYYDILDPVVDFDCEIGPLMDLYTDQYYTDYLHEDYFTGMEFTVLADHYGTTKIYEILMPTLDDPEANLCNVNLYMHHPTTEQIAVFYNIYNWKDEMGQNIFNMNKKMYFLWGFDSDEITFDREMIQEVTGYDFTFPDEVPDHGIKLHFDDIEMYNQIKFYADLDGDTYGDITNTKLAYPYAPPLNYILSDSSDCDDTNPLIFPGGIEICNALDDNCNLISDEGFALFTLYEDADTDFFGNLLSDTISCAAVIDGYLYDNSDCDDTNPTIYPGAPELADGLDNNCNDTIDEGVVSISDLNKLFSLNIYPNPAQDVFYIEIESNQVAQHEIYISMSNVIGEKIYSMYRNLNTEKILLPIFLDKEIASGFYQIQIIVDKQTISRNIFLE